MVDFGWIFCIGGVGGVGGVDGVDIRGDGNDAGGTVIGILGVVWGVLDGIGIIG